MSSAVAEAFRQHQRLLWGLAYRMTGSAADADDVVQDTFERATAHPPARTDEPLRPWLVRVAMNAARDALRRRNQRGYVGPWLPSPVEGDGAIERAPEPGEAHELSADARYERHESASYAFLIALEALSPPQRAVLLLRDVLDYTVRETSAALSLSEINVKVIHHRARRAMAAYDVTRRPRGPAATLQADTRAALERFVSALLTGDTAALEACMTDGARLLSDGGGELRAALNPVLGPARIARFFFGLQRKLGSAVRYEARTLNGLPGLVIEYDAPREGWARRFVMRCDVDGAGAIREVHVVVASAKLTGVAPIA